MMKTISILLILLFALNMYATDNELLKKEDTTYYMVIDKEGVCVDNIKIKHPLKSLNYKISGDFPFLLNEGIVITDNGFYDIEGKIEIGINIKYRILYMHAFTEGLAATLAMVDNNNYKWGYINRNGEVVIPFIFNSVGPFSEGLAAVATEDKTGYIDKKGNFFILGKFSRRDPFYNGLALIVDYQDNKKKLINTKGKIIKVFEQSVVIRNDIFNPAIIKVKIDMKSGCQKVYSESGKLLFRLNKDVSIISDFIDGRAVIRDTNKGYNYIDLSGTILIKKYFSEAYPFKNGYAIVGIHDEED